MKQPGGFVNDGADGLFVDKAVKECRTPIVKAFLGGGGGRFGGGRFGDATPCSSKKSPDVKYAKSSGRAVPLANNFSRKETRFP